MGSILVLGGAGYIGSHTVYELIEAGKEVLGWNPQYVDLETIIGTAWNWHKSHPNGYQNV